MAAYTELQTPRDAFMLAARHEYWEVRRAKALASETGTDEHGPYRWALCDYCDHPYQHRPGQGKPICNPCYSGA